MTDKEKARRYDELQRWFWWIERRTHNGKTHKINVATFLGGISKFFEPYKD